MRIQYIICGLIFVLYAALFAGCGCFAVGTLPGQPDETEKTVVSGCVTDIEGKPITGAKITIVDPYAESDQRHYSEAHGFLKPVNPSDSREAGELWAKPAPDGRLRISPMRQWSKTGLELREGQLLEIKAEGNVKGCQAPVDDWAYGPWGPAGGPSDNDPDSRVCALIGRIVGEGETHEFLVGEEFRCEVSFGGQLELGVSDVWHFDNSGEFVAAIKVNGKPGDLTQNQAAAPTGTPEYSPPSTAPTAKSADSKKASTLTANDLSQVVDPDQLVGWFKLPGRDTLIPVFKTGGTFYTVSWPGAEIPLKECTEGLEWGITPSSMEGTKIAFDEDSKSYSIIIVDRMAMSVTDIGDPEWQPVTKIDKPSWLLEAKAGRPKKQDDFIGWYQFVWLPIRFEIRKEGGWFFVQEQRLHEPGVWRNDEEPRELSPLPDRLGFVMHERERVNLTYNESLKRFEMTFQDDKSSPDVLRIPLARIPSPPSPEADAVPTPTVRIGIPTWH